MGESPSRSMEKKMLDIQPVDTNDGLESISKNSGIALIDADTIAYTACLEVEWAEECLPKEFYREDEWEETLNDPGYFEPEHTIYKTDFDLLLKLAKDRIESIRYQTEAKSVELYFSSGLTFRHKLKDTYKSNRKTMRYPEGLEWLKSELIKSYSGAVCDGIEADDMVVYLKRREPKKYKLCAVDKDVLNSVPGKHFDYFYKRMHWIETDIQTATKWPYLQTLMGDPADNIPGLRGIGVKTAEKLLKECILPCECWNVVVEKYIEKGESIKHAIETMRLVNMHQWNGKSIDLWNPPCVTEYERDLKN